MKARLSLPCASTLIPLLSILSLLLQVRNVHAFMSGEGDTGSDERFPLYSHWTITDIGLKRARYTSHETRTLIYRGNLFRDLSQIELEFVRKHFPGTFMKVINWYARKELGLPKDKIFDVSIEDFGEYVADEHLDHPQWLDEDGKLVKLKNSNGIEGKINPKSNAAMYLASRGPWTSGLDYIKRQLEYSVKTYRQTLLMKPGVEKNALKVKAFMHFGNALHSIQDFFSHSNVIELLIHMIQVSKAAGPNGLSNAPLMMRVWQNYFPWVGMKTLGKCGNAEAYLCYPLVTGSSGKTHSAETATRFNVLGSITSKLFRRGLNPFSRFLDRDEDEEHSSGIFDKIRTKVLSAIHDKINRKSLDIDESDITKNPDTSINPTHAELNKDTSKHPLHVVASKCAIDVTQFIAEAMTHAYHSGDVSTAVEQTRELFEHPIKAFLGQGNEIMVSCVQHTKRFIQEEKSKLVLLSFQSARRKQNILTTKNTPDPKLKQQKEESDDK